MTCGIDGCGRPVEAAGLCSGHRKRKTLGLEVNVQLKPRKLTPWMLLEKATQEFREATTPVTRELAKERVSYAARVYHQAMKDKPLEPALSPWEEFERAIADYWDADIQDDRAFQRMEAHFMYAARAYAATLGPIPKSWQQGWKRWKARSRARTD